MQRPFISFLCLFVFVAFVSASHFRYASIQWRQVGVLTIEFSIFSAWDGAAQNPSFVLAFGDGQFTGNILGSAAASIDQFGGYDVYRVAKLNHTYPSSGPWTATINACCREEALLNIGTTGSRYIISSFVSLDPYIFRQSPVSLVPPVVQFLQQNLNTFTIPIVYPDGVNPAAYTCSFSSPAASGIATNPPFSVSAGTSLQLNPTTCTLTWDLTTTSSIEGYAVQVTISSPQNGVAITLDFIIGIVLPGDYDCNFGDNTNFVSNCDLQTCSGVVMTWTPTTPKSEIFLINAIPADTYGFSLSPQAGRAAGASSTPYASSIDLAVFTFASAIPTGVQNIQCPQNCDDYCQTGVNLGFTFQFFGTPYSVVSLSSNGLLYFDPNCLIDSTPRRIPDGSSGNFIAALWADLYPTFGTWWYQTVGTAPNRVFLYTFENATYIDDTTSVQVQLQLFETSNKIQINILSAPSERILKSRSIGIENSGGSVGVDSYFGPAPIFGISYTYVAYENTQVQLTVSQPTYSQNYVGYVLFEEATPCLFSRYISQTIPVDFTSHELVPNARNLPTCDDCCASFTQIGFDFLFFGERHAAVTPESNGYLTVADECQSGLPDDDINSGIPSPTLPNQMVAGQLADLDVRTAGSWWTSTIGQVPNRIFLLTYEGVNYHGYDNTIQTTFQIKLFETSSIIEIHIVNAQASGILKTVGIENNNGTVGIQSLRTPLPIVATAFRYTPICDRRDIYCPYTIHTTRNCNLAVTPTITAPTCSNGRDGKIVLAASTTYNSAITYTWINQNPPTTPNTLIAPAGQYSVVVTDAGGCQTRLNLTIPAAPAAPYTVSAIGINAICSANGQAVYQTDGVLSSITWFGDYLPNTGVIGLLKPNPISIDTLVNGTYFARAYFPFISPSICYETSPISVLGPLTSLSASSSTTDVSCFGQNTGSATVSINGGKPPYTIIWTGGPVVVSPGFFANNLVAGAYNYTVTDSLGCRIGPFQIQISQPTQLSVNFVSAVAPTCFGRQDGSATFSVSGGSGAYAISWLDYDTDPVASICLSRNYLGTGAYRLQVTDSHGCKASAVGNVPAYTGNIPCLRARRNPNGPCNP